MIQYMIHMPIFLCAQKLAGSQLILPHITKKFSNIIEKIFVIVLLQFQSIQSRFSDFIA